jgi:hypothetical protein
MHDSIIDTEKLDNRAKILKTKTLVTKVNLLEAICFLLTLLFVYAAVSKLKDFNTFQLQLGQSPYITNFSSLLAWAVPVGELVLAATLIYKPSRIIGLYGSLFIMSLFTAYIFSMLEFSYYVPCSCGGILSSLSWEAHLWFNIAFVCLSVAGILIKLTTSLIK